jgi:hypothetical protein
MKTHSNLDDISKSGASPAEWSWYRMNFVHQPLHKRSQDNHALAG